MGSNDHHSFHQKHGYPDGGQCLDDEVHDLLWALMDEQIDGDHLARLGDLILNDAHARATFIQCVRVHADLQRYFARPQAAPNVGSPPPNIALPTPIASATNV